MMAVRTHVRSSVRAVLASGTLVLLVTACGSDKQSTEAGGQSAAPPPAPASANAPAAGATAGSGDVSSWIESGPAPATLASPASAVLADPDAVIARYRRECPGGTKSPKCHALRLDVEAIFLEALVAVRATNEVVDPRWYRLAAASETPQLACIGLNELIWDPKRTAQDEALIVRALDSPYRVVRAAVVLNANKLPALAEAMTRSGGFDYRSLSGVCVDNARDPVPGTKWAGGYPGARFRAFASNESRRWFTTPDSPEKVTAWFAARGQAARTAEQMAADAQANLLEEMTRLSENPEQDNTAKLMELMASQGSQDQWSTPFRGMEGIGEIKYVMIGANQAIAIFRDDALEATSIVATQPTEPVNLHPDLEAAREEAEMRAIFGY